MENTFIKESGIIINEACLSIKSSKLMERLRRECIFLRNDYFHSFFTSDTVTVDPESVCVKLKLGEQDLVEDYVKIYANSFGPFNPEKYFEKDTFRILWLLKEPYMKSGDLKKYKSGEYRYLGGLNQGLENCVWESMEENPTLENLIYRTQTMLQKITGNKYTEQETMNRVCIIEANHFPGLAFKSTVSDDCLVREWTRKNKESLELLINFYNPSVIIFGHTLEGFEDFDNFQNVFARFTKNELIIFGDKIKEWAYIDYKSQNEVLLNESDKERSDLEFCVWRNIKYLGESGRIYVQSYHPAYKDFINYNDEFIDIDCNRIKELMSKENGLIKSLTV